MKKSPLMVMTGLDNVTFLFFSFVEQSGPNAVKIASSLHYYTGDCTSPETRLQIQRQFIQLLNESAYNIVCRDPVFKGKCKAENVKVTCFVSKDRKRRSVG